MMTEQEHVGMMSGGMHEQCAWCTLVQSGPYTGMLVMEEWADRTQPVLVEGYTHGICPTCDAILRGSYFMKKAQKRMTPIGVDAVLRLEQTG